MLDFNQWRERYAHSPESVVNQFLSQLEQLSPETRRAVMASHPEKEALFKSYRPSLRLNDTPLTGIPYVLQDLFDVRGMVTTCGAPFSEPFEIIADESSLLAEELDHLGACCFGKTMPAEFGYGLRGRNRSYGNCPHARGLSLVCGGGAGSTAFSVYNGFAPLGFGLDGNGGMRLPAALHGLFGFRMAKIT